VVFRDRYNGQLNVALGSKVRIDRNHSGSYDFSNNIVLLGQAIDFNLVIFQWQECHQTCGLYVLHSVSNVYPMLVSCFTTVQSS
jgi:hypothetical protein